MNKSFTVTIDEDRRLALDKTTLLLMSLAEQSANVDYRNELSSLAKTLELISKGELISHFPKTQVGNYVHKPKPKK